ncbi:MAG: hypothetical protein LBR14_04440, partial [Clostridiales Family XIII bacterium]|nr:hypothetical protein [Clostridiales Family XIII bacterium]
MKEDKMKKTMRKFTALFATAILLVLLVAPTGVFADTEPQGVSTQGATGTILGGTLNVSLASSTTAVVGEETDFTTEFVAGSAAALVEATATISIVGPAGAVTAADWNLEILDAGSWRTFDSWSAGSFTLFTGYGPVNWRFVPKGAPGAYTITLTITSLPNDGTGSYLPGGSPYAGNEVITYTETINVVNEFTLSGTALDTDFAILNTSAPMEGATLYGGMWNEF